MKNEDAPYLPADPIKAWEQLVRESEYLPPALLGKPRRKYPLSRKQTSIVTYLTIKRTITTAQATELVGGNVYHNQAKHTGAVLSNMVKRGIIRRLRVGVYAL